MLFMGSCGAKQHNSLSWADDKVVSLCVFATDKVFLNTYLGGINYFLMDITHFNQWNDKTRCYIYDGVCAGTRTPPTHNDLANVWEKSIKHHILLTLYMEILVDFF